MGDKSRDIIMRASKLRSVFVLSIAWEFVFKTHGCGFYAGKMMGKIKVPNRVAPKLQRGKNSLIVKFSDGNKSAGVWLRGWYSLQMWRAQHITMLSLNTKQTSFIKEFWNRGHLHCFAKSSKYAIYNFLSNIAWLTEKVLLRDDVRLLRCIIDKLVSTARYEFAAVFVFI